jgi:RNA-binding protein YhbY
MEHDIPVTVQVGKFGVSETLIIEIIKQLKNRKTIKIKLLKSSLDHAPRKELIDKIINFTNSELVSIVGNVAVIRRKGKDA